MPTTRRSRGRSTDALSEDSNASGLRGNGTHDEEEIKELLGKRAPDIQPEEVTWREYNDDDHSVDITHATPLMHNVKSVENMNAQPHGWNIPKHIQVKIVLAFKIGIVCSVVAAAAWCSINSDLGSLWEMGAATNATSVGGRDHAHPSHGHDDEHVHASRLAAELLDIPEEKLLSAIYFSMPPSVFQSVHDGLYFLFSIPGLVVHAFVDAIAFTGCAIRGVVDFVLGAIGFLSESLDELNAAAPVDEDDVSDSVNVETQSGDEGGNEKVQGRGEETTTTAARSDEAAGDASYDSSPERGDADRNQLVGDGPDATEDPPVQENASETPQPEGSGEEAASEFSFDPELDVLWGVIDSLVMSPLAGLSDATTSVTATFSWVYDNVTSTISSTYTAVTNLPSDVMAAVWGGCVGIAQGAWELWSACVEWAISFWWSVFIGVKAAAVSAGDVIMAPFYWLNTIAPSMPTTATTTTTSASTGGESQPPFVDQSVVSALTERLTQMSLEISKMKEDRRVGGEHTDMPASTAEATDLVSALLVRVEGIEASLVSLKDPTQDGPQSAPDVTGLVAEAVTEAVGPIGIEAREAKEGVAAVNRATTSLADELSSLKVQLEGLAKDNVHIQESLSAQPSLSLSDVTPQSVGCAPSAGLDETNVKLSELEATIVAVKSLLSDNNRVVDDFAEIKQSLADLEGRFLTQSESTSRDEAVREAIEQLKRGEEEWRSSLDDWKANRETWESEVDGKLSERLDNLEVQDNTASVDEFAKSTEEHLSKFRETQSALADELRRLESLVETISEEIHTRLADGEAELKTALQTVTPLASEQESLSLQFDRLRAEFPQNILKREDVEALVSASVASGVSTLNSQFDERQGQLYSQFMTATGDSADQMAALKQEVVDVRAQLVGVNKGVSELMESTFKDANSEYQLQDFARYDLGGRVMAASTNLYVEHPSSAWWPFGSSSTAPSDVDIIELSRQNAERIIKSDLQPGNCWPFAGSSANAVIHLSHPTVVSTIAVAQPPFHELDRDSAVREFSVAGHKNAQHLADKEILGRFEFTKSEKHIQLFTVESKSVFEAVTIDFESNHGNPDFTCVYRVMVHGTPQQ